MWNRPSAMSCFFLQDDADIFFPTDFWFLELIDHYCSGWLKPGKDNLPKKGKKRRTITVCLLLIFLAVWVLNLDLSVLLCQFISMLYFQTSVYWCIFVMYCHYVAWYIFIHGRVRSAYKDENQRWLQPPFGWF